MKKEKLLKKICKKELISAWEWGARETRVYGNDKLMRDFRRYKRSLLGDLTRQLKKAGVLPL